MRKRERTASLIKGTFSYQSYNHGVSGPKSSIAWEYVPLVETITDEVGRNTFNNCVHDTHRVTWNPVNFIEEAVGDSEIYTVYTGWRPDVTPNPVLAIPLPSNGVGQFILRGVQSIRPKFKAGVSVPNFLYELKDLKHILPDAPTLQRYVEALSGVRKNPFTKTKDKFFSKKSRANAAGDFLAGQYLSAKFGYLPLIDDAFNLIEAFEQFNQRLDTFISKGRKPQTSHYREVLPASQLEPRVYPGTYTEYEINEAHGQVDYTFTMTYNYVVDLPKLYGPSLFYKFVGFRDNPRILWDAIPFSFLVDWVLHVGKALESLDEGAIPIKLNILSAGYSVRATGVRKHFITAVPNGVVKAKLPKTCFLQEGMSNYLRSPISIDSNWLSGLPPLPVLDNISITELTLGLALGKTLTSSKRLKVTKVGA